MPCAPNQVAMQDLSGGFFFFFLPGISLTKKLKEENTPPPTKYKKWTKAEEAKLIRLMREDAAIDNTEFSKQREAAEQVDTQRLIAMAKGRNPDKLIEEIIRANSTALTACGLTTTSTASGLSTASRQVLLIHLKFCLPSQFEQPKQNLSST